MVSSLALSHVALNLLHLGVYYMHSIIVWYSLLFEIISFSDDSGRTAPFCASPVAYSVVHPHIQGESASNENQSWFSFGCCYELYDLVDCNEMSIAAKSTILRQSLKLARILT